jgi:hypothetical protein
MKIWIEETLKRFESLELDGPTERLSSTFLNQWWKIPVKVS